MPWKESTSMSERLSLCVLAAEGAYSISQLAREFGISRKTAYKWIGRYQAEGDIAVFDRSRRPHNSPASTDEETVGAILDLHGRYPHWGPRKLRKLLGDQTGQDSAPSKTTVGRILSRQGFSRGETGTARQEAFERFERGEPNDLWQTDFAAPFRLPDGTRLFPIPVLDDHSRYCVSLIAVTATSSACALQSFRLAACRHGLPREILSDHGSAFGVSREHLSAFTVYMWALGVTHTQGRYAHPQTQGKEERFNQTIRKECIYAHDYKTLDDWNKCFEEYRQIYNNIRPHESLCDETPASRYVSSQIPFLEPDLSHKEEGEDLVHRRVDSSGKIWILQHHVKVGNGLAGWTVAARHEGHGIWTITFRGRSICQVSLAKPAPFKPRP